MLRNNSFAARRAAMAIGVVLAVSVVPRVTAQADTAPVAPVTLTTVSADALPTAQIDGVVWDQVVVGGTVYATGEFTKARPAGSDLGQNEVTRSNLLAYSITTGALTEWAPSLNAAGKVIKASPDGSRIFVGGSFTTVNGVKRNRIAAIDATTGALITTWNPNANSRVSTMTVRGDQLFLGGIFSTVGGQARSRVAAVSVSTGALLPFAPTTDAEVMSMTAPAGGANVVIGGRFTKVNDNSAIGMANLNSTTGASLPWAIGSVVRDSGKDSAIYSLTSDSTQVYGTGYSYGKGGNFEATFSAKATDGTLVYVSGCLGDTYDAAVIGDVLYDVSHAHNCKPVGANPEVTPRRHQHAAAQSITRGRNNATNNGGAFNGRPAPEVLHWLPDLATGSYTGLTQAAWTVEGNSQYVVLGGEFPRVNGKKQQGLVRFAISSIAPDKEGPQAIDELVPTVAGGGPGKVKVTWTSSYDRDNRRLTYQVLRGATLDSAVVAGTLTQDSAWYNRPTLTFTDGATAGTSQTYRIRVSDAFGNTGVSDVATITVPSRFGAAAAQKSVPTAKSPASVSPAAVSPATTTVLTP